MSNQYTYKLPFTEEQIFSDYILSEMSQDEIALKYQTSQHVIWRALKRMGIQSRVATKRNQFRENNTSWKGGRVLVAKAKRIRGERAAFGNGYFYILDPLHPNANKSGYVAEHILVATKRAGRPLEKGEMVHHANLNKHDNSVENLSIVSAKKHSEFHNQLEEIAIEFMKEGFIIFNNIHGYSRIHCIEATNTGKK